MSRHDRLRERIETSAPLVESGAAAAAGTGRVYQQAVRARRRLDRLDRQVVRQVLAGWTGIRRKLDVEIATLTAAVVTDSLGTTAALTILEERRHTVVGIIDGWLDLLSPTITDAQAQAATLALGAAETLTLSQASSVAFNQPSQRAVEQLLLTMRTGPLAQTLGTLGPATADRIGTILADGVAAGANPTVTVRRLRAATDLPRQRAQTIARTETLRAWRETTRLTMQANVAVTPQWQWLAACDDRTCAACWAMHGSVHQVDTPMGTHPQCRCTMVPVVDRQLLPDAVDVDIADGETLFAAQSESVQRRVLGPARYERYAAGELDLPAMVRTRTHPDWGVVRDVAPLT